MSGIRKLLLIVVGIIMPGSLVARVGFGPYPQEWNFVEVRPGAHMFWWLHYTIAEDVEDPTERPLVIWLQGGPGWSSSGFGNFREIGPFDMENNERNHTWIKDVNVLFFDNPVGSGFSYAKNKKLLCRNNTEIARDLVELLRQFLNEFPKFRKTPTHIFGESYGGKMAVEFAWELHKSGMECNLRSIGLGNPYISPKDTTNSYAPFLYQIGLIDIDGFNEITRMAVKFCKNVDELDHDEGFHNLLDLEVALKTWTKSIDYYNVLSKKEFPWSVIDDELEDFMREHVHKALNISRQFPFNGQSTEVQGALHKDFIISVTDIVELILNNTDVNVVVYSGHLDMICATPGTVQWVNALKWPGQEKYKQSERKGILINGVLEGYSRRYEQLQMYWVLNAGHMTPVDNPAAMRHILLNTIELN